MVQPHGLKLTILNRAPTYASHLEENVGFMIRGCECLTIGSWWDFKSILEEPFPCGRDGKPTELLQLWLFVEINQLPDDDDDDDIWTAGLFFDVLKQYEGLNT